MSGQRVSQNEDSFHISCPPTANRRRSENEPCFVAGNTLSSGPPDASRGTDVERMNMLEGDVTPALRDDSTSSEPLRVDASHLQRELQLLVRVCPNQIGKTL